MNRRAITAISAVHFFVDLYSGFFPIYLVIAGLDPIPSALIASLSAFVANAAQPFLGLWADRSRGKLPVFLAILGGAVCMSLIGLTRNYTILFVLVLLGKMGVSLFHPAGAAIASDAGGRRMELGFSLFTTIGTVGYSLSQPAFTAFTDLAGLTGSFLLAIPGVLLALAYLLVLPGELRGGGARISGEQIVAALRRRGRDLGLLFLIMVFRQAFMMTVIFFVAKLYAEWGFGRAAYATASTIFIFAGAVGVLLSGLLLREVSPKRVLALTSLATVPFFAGFLAAGARGDLALAGVLLGLTGLLSNAAHVTNVTAGQRMVPELTSLVSGMLMGFAWAVANFGQPLAAAASGRLGFPGMLSGFVALGVLPLVAAALALLLPSPARVAASSPGGAATP